MHTNYKTLKVEQKSNYIIIELNNGKVNALDNALVKDLKDIFTDLENQDEIKGILLSGRPHCFSAGLDVVTLATNSLEQAKDFWRNYLGAMSAMIKYSKPLVCAITGYAPAGGTTLALCADYRIMAKGEKYVMGLHEFKMSLVIPEMMADIYAYYLGEHQAWDAVQNARLFNSDEAKAVGLVNESVEVEEVLERSEKQLKKLLKIYHKAHKTTKGYFRKGLLQIANKDIEEMVEEIAVGINDPETRKLVATFLASLKR